MGEYIANGKQVGFADYSGETGFTHIADAGDSEKAHFLATAANAYGADKFDFGAEALLTLSPQWHGELVAKHHFVSALNAAIDALNQLDKVKKTLFYGRDNNLNPAEGQRDVSDLPNNIAGGVIGGQSGLTREQAEYFIHGAIGYATEAGEMLEALKAAINGNPVDGVNVMEESGDGKWYLAILAHVFGYAWGDDERRVIAKLRARFPNRFTEYDANVRNLDAERLILEGGSVVEFAGDREPIRGLETSPLLTEAEAATGKPAVERAAASADAAFAAVNNVGKPYADANVDGNKSELGKSPAHRSAPLPGENLARQPVRSEDQ